MEDILKKYRNEMRQELEEILSYWISNTIDYENGGFIGKIDNFNYMDHTAPKGAVLNSRILWAFSAAYNLTHQDKYLEVATRSYNYLLDYFIDKEFGGVYWSVRNTGERLDTRKQIYAIAFAVYGLSEYYKATGHEQAVEVAIDLYNDIVFYSYDSSYGGYLEALTRDWKEISDLRLSEKDANERKSMNTHLHILESFSNLYKVWPDAKLKLRLKDLINIFLAKIISNKNHHLVLFFDDQWTPKSDTISYGHDIEAGWLLQEAAENFDDAKLIDDVKSISLMITGAASEGLDSDSGLWYEYEPSIPSLVKEKHSWPQAEAMIGFFNSWQNSRKRQYLTMSINSWEFVKKHIKDHKYGEWVWGVKEDYSAMAEKDKVGFWKCPYHNSRACIEIIYRINKELGE